ncbi:unnamed protein product [Mesocestoides corti]|uniref:Retrotrans_gag domain-containing protein n=1 Tax=Mesocestoides corti TaxID=53468 RepID=A0A0R3U1E9_MESCO|nr:unnamed protein product [Mesocestoides corti]
MESTDYCVPNSQHSVISTDLDTRARDVTNLCAACELRNSDSSRSTGGLQKLKRCSSLEDDNEATVSSENVNFTKSTGADDLGLQFDQNPQNIHPELLQQLILQTLPETQPTSHSVGQTPFDSQEQPHPHVWRDHSTSNVGGIIRFIVPFEATINQDFPQSVLLTPCMSGGTYGIPIQPFVLSTKLLHLPQDRSNILNVDDISHGTNREANTDPQISPQLALDQKNAILNEMAKTPHPGFILLSIRHEKRGNDHSASPDCCAFTPNIKMNSTATRKFSRQRSRKPTPVGVNSGNSLCRKFEVTTVETNDGPQLDQKPSHSPRSRFRVTRIADSSSWWIPDRTAMVICVHDLKTSMIPDFVQIQAQKLSSLQPSTEYSYDELKHTFWNCLEPKYLRS